MEPHSDKPVDADSAVVEGVKDDPEPVLNDIKDAESSDSSSVSDSDTGSSSGSSSSGSDSSDSDSGSDSASDESEESEEEEARPAKRKGASGDSSRKKRFRFLDVEADVGSSDEEDEEFIDDDAAAREAREGGRESRELELLRREAEQRRKTGGGNRMQSVIQRIEERAAREGEPSSSTAIVPAPAEEEGDEGYMEGEFEAAAATSAALFPTADDFKLFFVRMAEPGKEREAVIQLSHKAAEEMRDGKECQIRSVFAIDSLRGYIYIEAPSDAVAKQFLQGIRKVQWYNLVLVPAAEMASVFRAAIADASEKFKPLVPGEFVRIKRHPAYKGDLARVVETYDRDVDVALVPRIDWFASASGGTKPAQGLFDDKVAEGLGAGEVERLRNPQTGQVRNHFRNEVFGDDGFLIKRFNRASLVVGEDVAPKLDELRWFRHTSPKKKTSGEDELSISQIKAGRTAAGALVPIVVPPSGGVSKSIFSIGEQVRVVSGDMKNLVAKIVHLDRAKKVVSLELPEAPGSSVQVLERDVQKHFALSDHVLVLDGSSEGDTGLITAISGGIASVLIDGEVREVKVSVNSLRVTKEISKGELAFGNFHLGQLVQFTKPVDSVGLVVRISKSGNFSLLGVDGKRYSVGVGDIAGSKSARDAMTVSRHGDVIKKTAVVKYFGDNNLVKSGTVKEIYRNAVFVKEIEKVVDGGFSVVDSNQLELVAASKAPQSNYAGGGAPAQQPAPQQTVQYRRPGQSRLEGKRVRIIKGPFKGQLAQVREDHDTRVQVSLEAKFRVVTIPKDCVRLEDEDLPAAPTVEASSGNLNRPPAAAMGSLSQPPSGYIPPSSTPFTPAPPHLSRP